MHEIAPGKWYSDVSVDEVLRYSGVRSCAEIGGDFTEEAVAAVRQVGESAMPKVISRECTLEISGDVCMIDGIRFVSGDLAKHLRGCVKALLFAATLGSGVDLLIARYSAVKISHAVMLQGAAAALIEHYCDRECAGLESEYEKSGLFLRSRFSPGYGDFSLDCQNLLTEHLSAYKYAGIAVSSGGQMTPMKSVTAVLGVSPVPVSAKGRCASGKCRQCPNTDCVFRRV